MHAWSIACVLLVAAGCVREGSEPPPPPKMELVVEGELGGLVRSEPAGISCGRVCRAEFSRGTVVTLRVKPDPGVDFAGWSGACAGTGLCTLAMRDHARVGASFVVAGTNRKVPESMRRPSDLDRDGVPDDRDECPVEPAASAAGQPDADGCPDQEAAEPDGNDQP